MDMISIIIPAHNEEKRIGKTLEAYGSFFDEKLKYREIDGYEIIIVLNACSDDTIGVARFFEKKNKRIRHLLFKEAGKGFAVIEGWKAAKGSLLGFVDADMATKPESFFDLIKGIRGYDGAIASRWLPDSIVKEKKSIIRKVWSWGFNMLIRVLFLMKYRDTQCGAKLFRKEVIDKIIKNLEITRWAFDVNLLYLCQREGFRIKEIPTVWEDKAGSKIKFKTPIQMFAAIIRLKIRYSLFEFIVNAYDRLLPEKLKFHNL